MTSTSKRTQVDVDRRTYAAGSDAVGADRMDDVAVQRDARDDAGVGGVGVSASSRCCEYGGQVLSFPQHLRKVWSKGVSVVVNTSKHFVLYPCYSNSLCFTAALQSFTTGIPFVLL